MPSELKSETARTNGAKSHGPTTAAGKEASSRNSLKHGMTARNTFILECEREDDFKEFLAEHIAIHQPVTRPEEELVDQMAIARWRIRRFVTAETVLIECEMVRNRDKVQKEFATLASSVHIAMAIRSLADESRSLSLMSRYESRHQRVHDKAYAALRELQQFRASHLTPELDPSPATPATAPSVSEGESPTHNPSASEGAPSAENKKSPNEPTAPPRPSPDIHLCPPVPAASDASPCENPEDPDAAGLADR
jgi:hypothetical protein